MNGQSVSLNGAWALILDPGNRGGIERWPERGFPAHAQRHIVRVPSVWQRYIPGYHGVAFYETTFKAPARIGPRVRLHVGAANYRAEGWLNGAPIGVHDGGYTPFSWDVTATVRAGRKNRLVIRIVHSPPGQDIEGTSLQRIPSSKETWYFPYAGIWGNVELVSTSDPRIEDVSVIPCAGATKIRVRATVSGTGQHYFSGTIRLRVRGGSGVSLPVRIAPGGGSVRVDKILSADVAAWTPANPVMHNLDVTLVSAGRDIDRKRVRFGLRTLDFKDGRLTINGRRIGIRGVLLQPNYPVSLITPPDRASAIREMEQIKACGFNLVRSHLKHLTDDQLAWCDDNGLLVYAETPIAWMNEPNPKRSFRIAAREIQEMIRAQSNHPSIVIWGIANENGRFAGAPGKKLLRLCAAIDPSRPAIDVSGWSMNIYPGGGWMNETHFIRPGSSTPEFIEDHHHYLRTPTTDQDRWMLRLLGRPDRMPSYEESGYGPVGRNAKWMARLRNYCQKQKKAIFISEFGVGGLSDLAATVREFSKFRAREKTNPRSARHLLDEEHYRRNATNLAREFSRRRLGTEFGNLTGFIQAAQEQHALGVRRQIEAMDHNHRISGFVLTQWNDAAWECDSGIVDVWRRP